MNSTRTKVIAGLLGVFGMGMLPLVAAHLKPFPPSKVGKDALAKPMDSASCSPSPSATPGS